MRKFALAVSILMLGAGTLAQEVQILKLAGSETAVLHARKESDSPERYSLLNARKEAIPIVPAGDRASFTLVGLDGQPLVTAAGMASVLTLNGEQLSLPGGTCEVVKMPDGNWVLSVDAQRVFPAQGTLIVEATPTPAPTPEPGGQGGASEPAFRTLLNALQRSKDLSLNNPDRPAHGLMDQLLENPEVANGVLHEVLRRVDGWQLLKDLNLEAKSFSNDDVTGLGVGFDLERRESLWHDGQEAVWGLDYRIIARGDLAFESELNPQDLLEGRVTLNMFRSSGGVRLRDAEDPDPTGARFEQLSKTLAKYPTDEAFLSSKEWSEISALAQDRFSTQVCFEIGLDAGLETDQAMQERHMIIGAHAALDVKGWRRDSLAARLNLFDHPFALIRCLTGYDRSFTPRGSTIPTLLIGIDRIEPEGVDPRASVGDRDGFQRFRSEVAFKTPVARNAEHEIFFVANWRYYKELSASTAVKQTGLDEYDFIYLALESQQGIFVSYNHGQLPFGMEDEEFFEVGWKFGF